MHCLLEKYCVLFIFIVVNCLQVLGRTGAFPLILLPQFGGYWIEGTNHEPRDLQEADQPPCPASHIKLETNSTAKIYRKHFMGKVRIQKKKNDLMHCNCLTDLMPCKLEMQLEKL